jgi:hypothetical protein
VIIIGKENTNITKGKRNGCERESYFPFFGSLPIFAFIDSRKR